MKRGRAGLTVEGLDSYVSERCTWDRFTGFLANRARISEREDWVAEREGFEPPEPLGSPDFESGRLNQTPEPLRDRRASMFAPAQSS
jgi:hypothetical protein